MLFDFNQEKTLEISTLEELRDLYLRNKNDDEILTISFGERDYSFLNKINFETENLSLENAFDELEDKYYWLKEEFEEIEEKKERLEEKLNAIEKEIENCKDENFKKIIYKILDN